MDDTDRFSTISFENYKSQRVACSVLAAEVIAFADLLDDAYALHSQFEHVIGCSLPMQLMTDSKSLFDIVSKGSRTSEKCIMLDIHTAMQEYQAQEISNIGFVRSENNIADRLTKSKKQAALLNILSTGRCSINCERWIFRDKSH